MMEQQIIVPPVLALAADDCGGGEIRRPLEFVKKSVPQRRRGRRLEIKIHVRTVIVAISDTWWRVVPNSETS